MSRVKKLLIAGLVLAIGMGLAWPFRKTGPSVSPGEPRNAGLAPAFDSFATSLPRPKQESEKSAGPRHTTAKMASTGDPTVALGPTASFDLAHHPSLANRPITLPSDPHTSASVPPTDPQEVRSPGATRRQKSTSRAAYATGKDTQSGGSRAEEPQKILHIVRNTDTLAKLAKRYLGDAGRAFEIFDLNRDQLSNPYLLPIGAKLKIPKTPRRELD